MIDAQEEFCFSEENTELAIANLKEVAVNITRSSPACGVASITLNLSLKSKGMTLCKYNYIAVHEFKSYVYA